VRVQAVNRAPDPSDWSGFSRGEVPAGKPSAPGTPTTTAATPVGPQAQIKVTWPAVTGDAANGDPVSEYTLVVYQGGSEIRRFTEKDTSRAVNLDPSQTDFTFKVSATNKAGTSALSEASAARRAAIAPSAPRNVVLTPHDGRVTINFDPPSDLNGNKASELTYEYKLSPSNRRGSVSNGGTIDSLTNGTPYSVELWATSSVAGVAQGASGNSNSATPFGKPIITCRTPERRDNAVLIKWNVNSNGRSLTTQSPKSVDGAGNAEQLVSGLQPSETGSVGLTYGNEAGNETTSCSGQANDPPPPYVTVYNGGYGGICQSDGTSLCYFVGVSTHNFTSNVTCTLDGGYATSYGPNESKRIGSSATKYPWRGTNIVFTVNCGGYTYTGKLPAP
jgi:hypothetical protein